MFVLVQHRRFVFLKKKPLAHTGSSPVCLCGITLKKRRKKRNVYNYVQSVSRNNMYKVYQEMMFVIMCKEYQKTMWDCYCVDQYVLGLGD